MRLPEVPNSLMQKQKTGPTCCTGLRGLREDSKLNRLSVYLQPILNNQALYKHCSTSGLNGPTQANLALWSEVPLRDAASGTRAHSSWFSIEGPESKTQQHNMRSRESCRGKLLCPLQHDSIYPYSPHPPTQRAGTQPGAQHSMTRKNSLLELPECSARKTLNFLRSMQRALGLRRTTAALEWLDLS